MWNVLIIMRSLVTWGEEQPCWKKGKTLDLYLRNRTKEKIDTWHMASTPQEELV